MVISISGIALITSLRNCRTDGKEEIETHSGGGGEFWCCKNNIYLYTCVCVLSLQGHPHLSEFLHLSVGQVLETHSIRDHLWFDLPHIFGISVQKLEAWQGGNYSGDSPSSTNLGGSKTRNIDMKRIIKPKNLMGLSSLACMCCRCRHCQSHNVINLL